MIRVELKDGLEVTGLLDAVQLSDMSLMLGKAQQRWVEGRKRGRKGPDMELVFLAGSKIRYISFPDKINIDAELFKWKLRCDQAKFKRNYIVDRPKSSNNV